MFREMRRKNQQLTAEEAVKVLEKGTSGVLSLMGDDGYTYGVPLSYVYDDGKIYFHSAGEGHKIDAIKNHDRVSFCVIDEDTIVPEKFTSFFRSAIAFGRVRLMERAEVRRVLDMLSIKYSPNEGEARMAEVESCVETVCMIEFDIEYLTGKEAIEYARERKRD